MSIDELIEVPPPTQGNDLLHSTQVNERSLTKASWDQNNQNGRLLLLGNLLFQISSDFATFETTF